MKKAFLIPLGVLILVAASFTDSPNKLVGHWQTVSPRGAVLLAVFRPDGSFDGFIDGKAFVSGKYSVRQDTLRMSDASCNVNYYGTYHLGFSVKDSVRFTVIQDTCTGRRRGSDGLTLGRIVPDRTKPAKR